MRNSDTELSGIRSRKIGIDCGRRRLRRNCGVGQNTERTPEEEAVRPSNRGGSGREVLVGRKALQLLNVGNVYR